MANGTELASAYVQILPSMEGIKGQLGNLMGDEASSAGNDSGGFFGKSFVSKLKGFLVAAGVGKMISDTINNGMDFETSMAKVKTLFSGTSEEFDTLSKGIKNLSSSTGVSAQTLAEAAYSAESASVPMANMMDMLEGASKLSVAGFTDVDTALSATAKTMNAYGLVTDDAAETAKNMEMVQRVLIQTQNKGITTVGELGQTLASVTPTASSFGVSFEQVGAALAGMTAQGTGTAEATTQLNNLISELGKNGTIASKNLGKAAEGSQWAGMSFKEMMENGADLNDVMQLMSGYADANGLSIVDMFGSINAGKGALSILGTDWAGTMAAMQTETDVVGEGFSTMADTVATKWSIMQESVKNIGLNIFGAISGSLSGLIGYGSDVINRLTSAFSEEGMSGLVDVLSQIVAEMFNKGSEMISSLANGLDQKIPEFISGALEKILGLVTTIGDNMGPFLESGIKLVSNILTGLVSAVPRIVEYIPKLIVTVTTAISNNLPKILEMGVKLIGSLISGIIKAIPTLVSNVPKIIKAIVDGIKSMLSSIGEAGKRIVSEIWEAIKNSDWFQAGKNIIDGIKNGVKNAALGLVNSVKDAAKTALNSVKNFLGIHSPSTVFEAQVGEMIPLGAAEGIYNEAGAVREAVKDMSREAIGSFDTDFTMQHSIQSASQASAAADILSAIFQVGSMLASEIRNKELDVSISESAIGRAATNYQKAQARRFGSAQMV